MLAGELQSLLLDPVELDLGRLLGRPDFLRRLRCPPWPLLELVLELDDLELELDDRSRRRLSLREPRPPLRDSSDDESSLLLRRPPFARRLLPLSEEEEEEDDDETDGDERRRRGGDDRPPPLRPCERERCDPSLARCAVSREALPVRLEAAAPALASPFPASPFPASALAGLVGFLSAWPLSFLSDSLGPCDGKWEEPRDGCFTSLALPEAAGALCEVLAAEDGGAAPGLPDEPMLDHLTWDRGRELAVFRPDDISSGSTPGGRGSVGSSS